MTIGTLMTYQGPPDQRYAQPQQTARRSKRPWWQAIWLMLAAVGIIALLAGIGIGTSTANPATLHTTTTATVTAQVTTTPTNVTATVQVTSTVTFTPVPATTVSAGTYLVGTDIVPGVYKTPGAAVTGSTSQCYYALLRSTSTTDIVSNDISSGPMVMTVTTSAKAVVLTGACKWVKS